MATPDDIRLETLAAFNDILAPPGRRAARNARHLLLRRAQPITRLVAEFCERLKTKLAPYNEETVKLILTVLRRDLSAATVRELTRTYSRALSVRPRMTRLDYFLATVGNDALRNVEPQDALCLKHLGRLSEQERLKVWLMLLWYLEYPLTCDLVTLLKDSYRVQQGLDLDITHDFDGYVFEEEKYGWETVAREPAHWFDIVLTTTDVRFEQASPFDEMVVKASLTHGEFEQLIMTLQRADNAEVYSFNSCGGSRKH